MPITYKPIDKQSRDFLHKLCLSQYLDGMCYEFALAAREDGGGNLRPMIGIIRDSTIRHVLVKLGEDKYFDARGIVSKEEIGELFEIPERELVLREVSKEDLRKVRRIENHSIEQAKFMIEPLWPELSIKEGVRSRMKAFTEDLEKLSRKHGIWIRAPYPTAMPILSFGDELEDGYVITPTANPPSYLIDRVLSSKG